MPSSVANLLAAASLEPEGVVAWGEPVPQAAPGVYVVALTDDPNNDTTSARPHAPVEIARLEELLDVRPELRLDGERPNLAEFAERLASFWLADEVALYIGLAGQPLRKRVGQYYRTSLGARRPHAGGWWLKTLTILDELWVHHAATPDFRAAERAMLRAFAEDVSPTSRAALTDRERVAPFANLRDGNDLIKRHGIGGATGALTDRSRSRRSKRTTGGRSRGPGALSTTSPAGTPRGTPAGQRSQPVTVKDKKAGRVRFPSAAKRLFPAERAQVEVVVRGTSLRARWDPRTGPDRERSGVLSFGRGKLDGLVLSGELLTGAPRADGRVTLD